MGTAGLNRKAKSEINRLMRERGCTRSDLARMLGVSRVTVTQMLSPSRNLTLNTFERAVRRLGYTARLDCEREPDTAPPQ